jgi:hypothetical protein
MAVPKGFSGPTLKAIHESKILGIRAGTADHRIIGIWVVVVEGRVFVRSWGVKAGGWYQTFLEEPRGVIQIGSRTIRIRAVPTKAERLKAAVSRAYREKYSTPGSLKFVTGFERSKRRRDATLELVPA